MTFKVVIICNLVEVNLLFFMNSWLMHESMCDVFLFYETVS